MIKLISVCILATLFVHVHSQRPNDCDKLLKDADKCLTKILMLGDYNMQFIKNSKDLDEHCSETKKNFACIKKYGKCLTGFPREVFNLLSKNARKLNKNRCEDPKGREEFLTHIKCLDEVTLPKINKCIDKTVRILEYLSANITGSREDVLSASCCGAHLGLDCMVVTAKKVCNKKTKSNTDEYFSQQIDVVLSDVTELTCSDYATMAACEKKKAKFMKSLREVITPDSRVKKAKSSPLIPMIGLIDKIKLDE